MTGQSRSSSTLALSLVRRDQSHPAGSAEFHVTVEATDLSTSARDLVGRVQALVEAVGGSSVDVVASEDDTRIAVNFGVVAADDDEARDRGHAVLDGLDVDSGAWSVGVFRSFRS